MLNIQYRKETDPPFSFSPKQDPIRVAIYARASSDNQDIRNSVDAQVSECKAYASRNNMVVVAIYADEAETGTNDHRLQFQQIVKDGVAKDHPFDIILVWKFSRFSRSREDNPVYKALLKKRGVRIVSINEQTDDSPSGRFMEGIIEEVDAFYSDNLGHEVRRGLRKLAERGYYPGNKAPYGYKLKKVQEDDGDAYHNILDIDPVAAPIVRRIFDEITAGQSRNDVRRGLNADGITPPEPRHSKVARSKEWSKNTIGSIVHNLEYAGFIVWGKKSKGGQPPVVAPGRHKAIVSPDEFKLANEALSSKAPEIVHPRQAASDYMLSEMLQCGKCGKYLTVRHSNNAKYRYYICKTRTEDGVAVCNCPNLNIWNFEEKFLEALFDDILCTSNVKAVLSNMSKELMGPYEERNATVLAIEAQIKDVSARKSRIMDGYEAGAYSVTEYVERTAPLHTMEGDLQRQLERAQDEIDHQVAALEKAGGSTGVHQTGVGIHPALAAQRTPAHAETVHQRDPDRHRNSDSQLPHSPAERRQAARSNRTGNGS